MENWDIYVDNVAELVSHREGYQKALGKIALEIRKDFGVVALKRLAEDIKERHGIKISASTLHNYSWVESKLAKYDLPEDIPYRLKQVLATRDDVEKWIKEINEGGSVAEIYKKIRGIPPKRIVDCPRCGYEFELS